MIWYLITTFLVATCIAWASIPVIIKVAKQKHLYDEPNEDRKSHNSNIPTLGGVSIFSATVIAATFFGKESDGFELGAFLSAITILFFTGIKDDIIPLPAYKKFIAQLAAALIIVFWGNIQLSSFYGFCGLYAMHPLVVSMASIFTILVIINSINLIDGINGLAGGIGFIALATLGLWFYFHNEQILAIWNFATCGALAGFLYYNLRTQAKIFMGDTGSLILGFICAVMALKFIELNKTNIDFAGGKAPIFAIAVLIVPLFDTLRVFAIRIATKRSPFSGDRNHLHHLLLDIGCSHLQASFILYVLCSLSILIAYNFRFLHAYFYLAVLVSPILVFTQILLLLRQKKNKKQHLSTTSIPGKIAENAS